MPLLKGNGGESSKENPTSLEAKVQIFCRIYANSIFADDEFHHDIDAEMVHETFRSTPGSVPGMDGWEPREVSFFSLEVCM